MDLWPFLHSVLIELTAFLVGPTSLVLFVLGSGEVNGKGVLRSRVRALASRIRGPYHRLVRSEYVEHGERELFRADVMAMQVSAFDGEMVERGSLCVLTDRRLILANPSDGVVRVSLLDVGTVRTYRDYDPHSGFFSCVVVDRAGCPGNSLLLRCQTGEQSYDLSSRIQTARRFNPPVSESLVAALS